MEFVKQHWPWFVAVGLPLLATVMIMIGNRFADPDNDPTTPPPKWVRVLFAVADVFSFVARAGKEGLIGRANLPGVPSMDKAPKPPTALLLLFVGALGLVLAGSGCGDLLTNCDKTSITVATTSAKGYKVVNLVDEAKQDKIRARARVDALAAEADFKKWKEQRGVAFKVFDGGIAAVEGYAAARPELAKAADRKKAAAPWIVALAKAAAETATKLAELEVIPGGAP